MEKKTCPRCHSRLLNSTGLCKNCGYFIETQFNEPLMWLGWETY